MEPRPFEPTFESLPGVLPVFPLSGALLLPRCRLPLNIFEPRYLQMTQDALAGDRLIGSTEVLESIIGKYKRVQSCHSKGGMTSMLLSIGAMVGKQTRFRIKQALELVRSAKLDSWCKDHLGMTIQSQRRLTLSATKLG